MALTTIQSQMLYNNLYGDASGNVGIGTSSPSVNLAVVSSSTLTRLHVQNSTSGTTSTDGVQLSISGSDGYLWNFENGFTAFGTNNTERMRIDSYGNLLVGGTGSAVNRLYVQDTRTDSNRTAIIINAGNTSGNQCLGVTLGSNTNNTSSYFVVANGAGADRLYIYGNGNIVNLNNSYGALSDITIKENVIDTTPKLEDLCKVKVRNYNLIADESKTKQIGVVAQELEEVFPSMVEIDGISGHKQVKYSVFVPMLIKAIQELKAELDTVKTELATLKAQ